MSADHSPSAHIDPFPKWVIPAWLFVLLLIVGRDWQAMAIYGGIPLLALWILWTALERSKRVSALPMATVDSIWQWTGRGLWAVTIIVAVMVYSANHHFPKGPMIATGEEVCANDGRGPCGEQMVEDTRNLNVPNWVKTLKDGGIGIFLVLFLAAGFVSSRPNGGYKDP